MGRKKNNKKSNCNSSMLVMKLMYDMIDPIVEEIYVNCVKLDEEETKALNERFGKVIDKFVETMKEVDPTFKEIFNKINYTGSFYDGLRISEATEFNLNLVLKPNFRMNLIRKRRPAGFIAIKVDSSPMFLPAPYKDWLACRENPSAYFLNPNAVRWWLQGVVTKAIIKLENEEKLIHGCKLKIRQSGPAWTLSVTSLESPSKTIDIDLVPVLEFSTREELIDPSLRKKTNNLGLTEPWFAVPKPPSSNCPCFMCISWRMSFPLQESAMIQDLHFFKYTLRMIKKVRDELGIHEVASYYIKTLFLLELLKNGPEQWMQNPRGHLFIYMLICLIKALENGRIPFVWNQNCNLIGNVSKDTLRNSAGQLQRFCDRIDKLVEKKDHEQLKNVFQSLLNSQQDKKKPIGQEKLKDEDSDSLSGSDSESDTDFENETCRVSHAKGLKAACRNVDGIHQPARRSNTD